METRVAKWWGWGWEDVSLPVESRPALWRYIQERLKVDPGTIRPVVPLESVRVPPCLVSPGEVEQLRRIVGEENISIEDADRITHAMGRSYRDLIRLRSGRIPRAPDVVAFPEDEDAIRRLLEHARRRRYAIIPFGGGTGVVGGVEPAEGGDSAAVVTVDLRRMRRVHEIDVASGLATVDAGIRGPILEEALAAKGLTLGHVPQSWEFSTLGGWIATRAAGGLSNRYGKIDDLVVGLRLVAPAGTLDLKALPNEAHGPDLKEIALGSEGILGIVTRATVRIHPIPQARRFASRLFRSFTDGLAALRGMAREGALPDMTYLSDEEETRFVAANEGLRHDGRGGSGRSLALRILSARGFSLSQGSLLLMGFEGSRERVSHRRRRALGFARRAANLGPGPAHRWHSERFEMPYLRDSLLDHGILVDTVETAASWSRLPGVYEAGRKALQEALWASSGAGLVLCHASHVYADGVSLYFTFLGRQREGAELAQWEGVKAAVTRAFVDAGGALSHHHGIGADHAPYLGRMIGEDGLVVLHALKRELDPEGIMNPGKLIARVR